MSIKEIINFENISLSDLSELIIKSIDLELYEEGFDYVVKLIEMKSFILNEEERNNFMKLAKEKLNLSRKGWKNIIDFDQTDKEESLKTVLEEQSSLIEKQIKQFCQRVDKMIDKLLGNVNEGDIISLIFYKKLKADYLRYYSEVANETEFNSIVDQCHELYEKTYDMCKNLDPCHVLTLSVALNFSVFVYFIVDDTKKAFEIADKAYKLAMEKSSEIKNPESNVLIRYIEDNLTIWKIELFDSN